MKKYLFLLFLFMLLAACQPAPEQSPAVPTLLPATTAAAPTPTLATPVEAPTDIPVAATAVSVEPTAVPTTSAISNPQFSNLVLLPNASAPQPDMPFTTQELYAVWDYAGMTAADQLERLWYFNGELWLERDEPWDMAQYGANGRIGDVFIYDYEPNLRAGDYRLVLKVNGVELASAEHTIPAFTVGPIVEPESGLLAAVQNHKALVMRRPDGSFIGWESFGDIVDLAWLPGGQNLVYSEQVVVNAELPGTLGLRHNLWLHNVITGQKQLLSTTDDDLHSPVVSPDGRYLALYSGTLYGDACYVDANVHIMELNSSGQRVSLVALADFSGLPVVENALPQPDLFAPNGGPFDPTPGTWLDGHTLATRLTWYCATSDAAGLYALDINGRTAVKIAEDTLP
ncbi:MAG: hypothetical protein H6657_30750 [Ardenticatenaceae bacterium]|nr:hypothetical protein [Ardenticatenaceae bacterium]